MSYLKSRFRKLSFIVFCERLRFEPMETIAKILAEQCVSKGSPLRILDLGGGSGHYWHVNGLGKLKNDKVIEIFLMDAAYEEQEQETSITKIKGVIPGALSLVPSKSYDVVIGLDLIEHLSKSDGCLLLYEMDRIASGLQIILTPNGFVWQPPSENNPYNAHISGWELKEFMAFGYKKFFGLTGSKRFIGPYSQLKRQNPSRFHRELVAVSAILVRFFPKFAFSILCVKFASDSSVRIVNQKL